MPGPFSAVLWDFGGVILSSPFDAFARYEAEIGLPDGFIRRLNATNPDDNAWAKLERSDVSLDEFCNLFEAEARAAGGELSGHKVISLLAGEVRPDMVAALRTVAARYKTACLTNNVKTSTRTPEKQAEIDRIMGIFGVVVESSKVGVRKPEPAFYAKACAMLEIEPHQAIFLDDLGVNLKPARAMGMATIKVASPAQALGELEILLGHPVR
ncbi:MAG: HAD-IA family hydrolase [Alphaproteobacteria bacterium]|nr:HAD-IA family hydrolase [Alphaproteobacteria bacterium]MCB9929010.1 HAD-IA family hydrolase [Alphaproteobacteria bacterium]